MVIGSSWAIEIVGVVSPTGPAQGPQNRTLKKIELVDSSLSTGSSVGLGQGNMYRIFLPFPLINFEPLGVLELYAYSCILYIYLLIRD